MNILTFLGTGIGTAMIIIGFARASSKRIEDSGFLTDMVIGFIGTIMLAYIIYSQF